ncbi:hypothetical protein ANN_02301 [Periplaneta americana]|uniref:Uncharacterized protein n=1 Tax=Periplaneta americana TaxID=6978 RepID=A0ABQ8TW01_PERAM|nr:hypothetical protein ANN_02301 [Periplaneta americana]
MKQGRKITLIWIPSHQMKLQMLQKATRLPLHFLTSIPHTDAIKYISRKLHNHWQTSWTESSSSKLHKIVQHSRMKYPLQNFKPKQVGSQPDTHAAAPLEELQPPRQPRQPVCTPSRSTTHPLSFHTQGLSCQPYLSIEALKKMKDCSLHLSMHMLHGCGAFYESSSSLPGRPLLLITMSHTNTRTRVFVWGFVAAGNTTVYELQASRTFVSPHESPFHLRQLEKNGKSQKMNVSYQLKLDDFEAAVEISAIKKLNVDKLHEEFCETGELATIIQSYEIFPRRPNAISRMMSETRSARKLRDEARKTNSTNTASESDSYFCSSLVGSQARRGGEKLPSRWKYCLFQEDEQMRTSLWQ